MSRSASDSRESGEFSSELPFPERWLQAERGKKAFEELGETAGLPTFGYPWNGLEEFLNEAGDGALRLVGYGSLVNAASAAMTVSGPGVRRMRPVVAFGVRRVFNYVMNPANSSYSTSGPPQERALLNVRVSGKIEHALNGTLLEVGLGDLPALRQRESDYDLAPVVCLNWAGENRDPFVAWILACRESSEPGKRRVNNGLLPNREYYAVCRDGAASFGAEFLAAWLDSTFLGDGETSVRDWECATPEILSRETIVEEP